MQDFQSPESLIHTKSQKELILTGAARFNTKPKAAVAFLEEKKLIYNDISPNISKAYSLAKFLKECTRLDKRLLGDFISKPENIDILKAFIGLFNFRNVRRIRYYRTDWLTEFEQKPMADAMRELLESFRLPGEAQQIARITETFASIYFASDPRKQFTPCQNIHISIICISGDQERRCGLRVGIFCYHAEHRSSQPPN